MKRRKQININKYVRFDEEQQKSVCLYKHCKKALSGRRRGNIKRHYKLVHKKLIDFCADESDSSGDGGTGDNDIEATVTSVSGNKFIPPIASSHVVVAGSNHRVKEIKSNSSGGYHHMDKNAFLKCCIGLVTVKRIPLRIFDDQEFFKRLIRPYEERFNVNMNSKTMKTTVDSSSQKIQKIITERVENRMVSLRFAIATQKRKSILEIIVQYVKDYRIYVHTIGVLRITKRHTVEILKDQIVKCMEEFKINADQIYSNIVFDSETNQMKATSILTEAPNENITSLIDNQLEEHIQTQLTTVFSLFRCPTNTFNSIAFEIIKILTVELEQCRKFVKKLRTFIKTRQMKTTSVKLDNPSSWRSTYAMIDSILSQKDNLELFAESSLASEVDWNFIQNFINAFKPLIDFSTKFHGEQYTLGDFYRDWLCCELELEEIIGINFYAHLLHETMIEPKQKLFDNEAFLAVLYLDPRFNFKASPMLNEEQKQKALSHLLKTYEAIQRLDNTTTAVAIKDESIVEIALKPEPVAPALINQYGKLAQHIKQMIETATPSTSTGKSLKQKLNRLSERMMEPLDTNVLDYFRRYYSHDRDMSELIQVVLAYPITQVSIEHDLSKFSAVFTKLSGKDLTNFLLTKLNFNLLE